MRHIGSSRLGSVLRQAQMYSFDKRQRLCGPSLRAFCDIPRRLVRQDSEMARMSSIELVPSLADEPEQLAASLSELQAAATSERVPWFQNTMPPVYFRQVPRERRLQHLVAIAAVPDMSEIPEIITYDRDSNGKIKTMAMISSGHNVTGFLENQVQKLPKASEARLTSMNLYRSTDDLVSITEFGFADSDGSSSSKILTSLPLELKDYVNSLQNGDFESDTQQYYTNTGEVLHASPGSFFESKELLKFASSFIDEGVESKVSPRRLCKFAEMYQTLLKKGTDEVILDVETDWNKHEGKVMYTIALTNVLLKPTLARIIKFVEFNGLEIERCHLDRIKTDSELDSTDLGSEDYNDVAFLRFLVNTKSNPAAATEMKTSLPLVSKWYGDVILSNYYEILSRAPFSSASKLKLIDFEVAVGLLECVHLIKSGTQMYEFSRPNVLSVLERPQTFSIVDVFKKRFHPDADQQFSNNENFQKRLSEIEESIERYIEIDLEKKILQKMIEILKATSRTNLYQKDRFAFALKLNPEVCMDEDDTSRTTTPFGVFYVSGRRFNGIQIRFREIARGGLRLVTPKSPQALTIESTRQFGECYDLAFAQQQKNKDIAEGGSKAVCLIDTCSDMESAEDQPHLLKKSVKAFVNSLLDLITVNDANKEEELIFLGPDEQVTIDHINWIISRAEERNYRMPSAFMSSKPDQGINHKEFGVTSEGVQVFLNAALKTLQLIPKSDSKTGKEYFTVKITGGPDGDVAGNMLKILYREYGSQCRVVGIADGTGCVEDEQHGISWDELLRLVDLSLPLSEIDASNLKDTTKIYKVDNAEGVSKRNTMHNRIRADAFIPGGGRPQTINGSNWEKFLIEENGNMVPSSKLIVEGANLFLTNEAREHLCDLGCVIVKDSSANKCGVICSSFEIMSSMLLEKQQFLDIKPKLVPQVVKKLRDIAAREADLLMREYQKNTILTDGVRSPFNLVAVSIELSSVLNRTIDSVRGNLQRKLKEDANSLNPYMSLVKDFLPTELVDAGWNVYEEKVPGIYTVNLVSTILACELVYKEGIDFVKQITDDEVLAETALNYFQARQEVGLLSEHVASSQLSQDDKDTIIDLLQRGGARAALVKV